MQRPTNQGVFYDSCPINFNLHNTYLILTQKQNKMKKNLIYTSVLAGMLFFAGETNAQWSLTGNAGTNAATNFIGTTDATSLRFRTNNGNRMSINSVGRVGIGTTNPTNRLTVFGGNAAADTARSVIFGLVKRTGNHDIIAVDGASQPAPGYGIGVRGVGNFCGVFGQGSSGLFGVIGLGGLVGVAGESSEQGQTQFLTGVQGMTSGGDVSVGVYGNSSGALNNYGVYGEQQDTTVSDYALVGIGDVYAWRYFQASDRKLKKDIQSYTGALDKVNQLVVSTYSFDLNSYPGMKLPGGSHIGFMADNVEQLFPQLIKNAAIPAGATKDARGNLSYHNIPDVKVVNYMGMIPVLAEAIKEQHAIVEAKDAQIAALAAKLSEMESRLAALEETSSAKLSSSATMASIEQNAPNPFTQSTVINYTVPQKYSSAKLIIVGVDGKAVRTYTISGTGKGSVTINANELAAGTYTYSLNVDGSMVDSKTMVLTK